MQLTELSTEYFLGEAAASVASMVATPLHVSKIIATGFTPMIFQCIQQTQIKFSHLPRYMPTTDLEGPTLFSKEHVHNIWSHPEN